MTRLDLLSYRRIYSTVFLVFMIAVTPAADSSAEQTPTGQEKTAVTPPAAPAEEEFKRFRIDFEADAYYTNIGLYVALTKTPIPHLGEKTEKEIYTTLLSQSLTPRFLVIEASVNPLPYLGTYIKEHHPNFYDNAHVTDNFNWIQSITAGFEEPYAASAFVGNVVDFNMPGQRDAKRKGYIGYLVSAGNYHIKDNELVKDDWREFEWKIKGDKKTETRKLDWSFRVGAKLHENPDITDIIYLAFRRSRADYRTANSSLFNNSGFEYIFDMDRRTFNSIRHYFSVDKKWPVEKRKMAFSFAVGFIWESARKYTGPLAVGRDRDEWQLILRPNIEF